MDDDIQTDNELTTDSTPDPRDSGDDADAVETSSSDETMETRTRIFLDGPFTGRTDEVLVNKSETTILEDGFVESTDIRIKSSSGCGHVLHTASEAGLRCISCSRLGKEPLILCSQCAKDPDNVCYVCNSACCWQCRDERYIDGEKRIVCKACVKTTLRLKLIKQIVKWLLIAGAIFYLVMF